MANNSISINEAKATFEKIEKSYLAEQHLISLEYIETSNDLQHLFAIEQDQEFFQPTVPARSRDQSPTLYERLLTEKAKLRLTEK